MYKDLSDKEFAEALKNDDNGVLLDVRTPAEVSEEKIPNSINLNIMDSSFLDKIQELDKAKSYYVYCRSGGRSAKACMLMHEIGIKQLVNLQGGILGWTGDIEYS